MTYDCISDCLGCDSIPTPRSAGDGGIAGVSDGEIEGCVAGNAAAVTAAQYQLEIWMLEGEWGGGGGELI